MRRSACLHPVFPANDPAFDGASLKIDLLSPGPSSKSVYRGYPYRLQKPARSDKMAPTAITYPTLPEHCRAAIDKEL